MNNVTPIDRQTIKRSRHKYERGFYVVCVMITAFLLFFALFELGDLFIDLGENPDGEHMSALVDEVGEMVGSMLFEEEDGSETASGYEYDEEYEDDGGLLSLFLAVPVIILFWLYMYFAEVRAYAIRVTEKNFPEIYWKSVEFAQKLGMKKVPAVYIEQQNGILNAFAAAVLRRRYIMLNAELVDIAYMEHKDFDTVFFVLAHEMGHQYYNHVTFGFNFWTFVPHIVPVFGFMHLRAMEYSCDRIAQLLMERDCVHEALVLSAGRHLYKYVDASDYLHTALGEKGLFMWFINMMATHPIMPKRISALADPQRKSGKLLFGNSRVY